MDMALGVAELGVLMVFGIPLAAIVGWFLLSALKILKGGKSQGRGWSQDETRIMQEIYQSLQSMERRIDALETIILDRSKRPDSDGGS